MWPLPGVEAGQGMVFGLVALDMVFNFTERPNQPLPFRSACWGQCAVEDSFVATLSVPVENVFCRDNLIAECRGSRVDFRWFEITAPITIAVKMFPKNMLVFKNRAVPCTGTALWAFKWGLVCEI